MKPVQTIGKIMFIIGPCFYEITTVIHGQTEREGDQNAETSASGRHSISGFTSQEVKHTQDINN